MTLLTDLADQAVILPIVVLIGLLLLFRGDRRSALAWAVAIPGTLGFVLAAKLSVSACDARLPLAWNLHSPSGHAASAALVVGGIAALFPRARPRQQAFVCAILAAVVIGTSRLALGAHTLGDVLAGSAIGIIGACAFATLTPATPVRVISPSFLVANTFLMLLLVYGLHWTVEEHIRVASAIIWPLTLCNK